MMDNEVLSPILHAFEEAISLEAHLAILSEAFADRRLSLVEQTQLAAWANTLDTNYRQRYTELLGAYLPGLLRANFFAPTHQTFALSPDEMSHNTFIGYWTLLAALNPGGNILPDDLDIKDSFAQMLKRARPVGVNLQGQDLSQCNMSYLRLAQANFSHADLSRAYLIDAELTEANFHHAQLSKAKLSGADCSNAFFAFADMQEAQLFSSRLTAAKLHGVNLNGADLSQLYAPHSDWANANLYRATLTSAKLTQANLWQTDAREANLTRAELASAHIEQCNFFDAILSGADFSHITQSENEWRVRNAQKANFAGVKIDTDTRRLLQKLGANTE